MRIKFTFDDYENPPIDSVAPSVHFDPAVVDFSPSMVDPSNTYNDVTVIRSLPPNSSILTLPNQRQFQNANGDTTNPYSTTGRPYNTLYSNAPTPASSQAEGRHFPVGPYGATSNTEIKSGDRFIPMYPHTHTNV